MRQLGLIFFVAVVLLGCKKKDNESSTPTSLPKDTEGRTILNHVNAEWIANDIFNMCGQLCESGTLSTFNPQNVTPCSYLTLSAQTYTLDFSLGCIGSDGRKRYGKLIFDFSNSPNGSAAFKNPGFVCIVKSVDFAVSPTYTVNVNSCTISNTSPLSVAGQTAYTGIDLTWNFNLDLSVKDRQLGDTVRWIGNQQIKLSSSNDTVCYKGQQTPINWKKAKIEINGSSYGRTTYAEFFEASSQKLIKDFTCVADSTRPDKHIPSSGTITFIPGGRAVRKVDFGNGECDTKTLLTINGEDYPGTTIFFTFF